MATLTAQTALDQPTFIWEGKNKDGVKIRGEDRALNANMLKATLRRKGIKIRYIRVKRKSISKQKIKPESFINNNPLLANLPVFV